MHVPEGWSEEKLGDLFEFKNGANTEAANYGSGIKFVNVMDIFNNNVLTCEKIRESVNLPGKKADLYRLKNGDVLFNRTSETFDEIALTSVYLDYKSAIFGGFVIRGRPISNRLNPQFCIYCFSSSQVRKESIRRGQGAIRANIGQADLRYVLLLVPPLPEQQKIAQILSTWDKAIEKLHTLITSKQKRKKALMQQLLTGKKRFAGFEGEWKFASFDDLFIVENDNKTQVKSSDYLELGSTPIIDQGQKVIAGFTNNKTVYKDVPVIIFGDHTRIVKWVDFAFAPGADGTQVLKTRNPLDLRLGFFLLSHIELPNLGYSRHMRELKEKEFKFPTDKQEQQKIASVLSAADKEIETHQKELSALKQQKKGLMQQLLTGKKRVKLDEPVQMAAAGA